VEENQTPSKSFSPNLMLIIAVVAIVAVFGFMLTKAPKSEPKEEMAKVTETETVVSPDQTISVEGGEFYFKPNEIKVKKGQTIKILFNDVKGFHDFVIDEFNVKTPQIKEPNTAEVTFVADKAGSFEFYCSVGKHREMGMKGKLIVEE